MSLLHNSPWRVILIVTLLNLLGEFGFRTFSYVSDNPLLFFYLLITYLTFAIMCEYQISKRKLNYIGLYIFSFILVLVWQIIFPIALFSPPRIIGINWFVFLFVDILMWSPIQAVLFFYLARRLFPRKLEKSKISLKTYRVAFIVFCLVTLIPHSMYKFIGLQNIIGYFVLVLLLIYFIRLYRKHTALSISENQPSANSLFLDLLGIVTVIIMAICAFLIHQDISTFNVAHIFNQYSYLPMLATTSLVSAILYFYHFVLKRDINIKG